MRPPLKWGLLFAAWTLFAVFFAGQAYLHSLYVGKPVSGGRALTVWLSCSYIWALLTPSIFWLAHRFPIERGRYGKNLALHLLAGSALSLLQIAVYMFVNHLLLGDPAPPFSPWRSFRGLFVAEFHLSLVIYWSLVGLRHAHDYYRRYREAWRRRWNSKPRSWRLNWLRRSSTP